MSCSLRPGLMLETTPKYRGHENGPHPVDLPRAEDPNCRFSYMYVCTERQEREEKNVVLR